MIAKKADRVEQMRKLAEAVSPATLAKILRGDTHQMKPISLRRVRTEMEALGLGDLLPTKEGARR